MSDPELDDVADDLDASSDEVDLAMDQRRSQLKALAQFERVVGRLLTAAEAAAVVALQLAIQGAIAKS